jgi:hypothetical protein
VKGGKTRSRSAVYLADLVQGKVMFLDKESSWLEGMIDTQDELYAYNFTNDWI